MIPLVCLFISTVWLFLFRLFGFFVLFLSLQSRQSTPAQHGRSPFAQFSNVELFGLSMLYVEVPAATAIATAGAQSFKSTGSIAGSTVLALVDKTLHQQNRMPPFFLPVGVKPFEAQAQDTGS